MLKLKSPNYLFGTFYSSLKNAINKKINSFSIYHCSFNLILCYFLYKKRYFSNIMMFTFLNRSFIHITINYTDGLSTITNIFSFYSKKNVSTMTVRRLRNLNKSERSCFILSSSCGILDTSDAITRNVGGIVLFEIY